MSVRDTNVIDLISIDKNNNVVLTISDDLEWDLNNEHLFILQDKINTYLASIDSGNIYEIYPKAKDRNITINLAAKYNPNKEALIFLKKVKEIIESASHKFTFAVIH